MPKYHSSHRIKVCDLRPIGSKYAKVCMECGATKKGLVKPCVWRKK